MKGEVPKEGFWQIQFPIYYDRSEFKKVGEILEKLVEHYPKWSYWKNWEGCTGKSVIWISIAYEAVYLNGELKSESDIKNMGFYQGADVPYRAAKIIEAGIEDEILEETSDNYKLLADSWYQAYELRSALQSYEKASKLSDSDQIQFRIASIYLDLGEDKNAYRASLLAEKEPVSTKLQTIIRWEWL